MYLKAPASCYRGPMWPVLLGVGFLAFCLNGLIGKGQGNPKPVYPEGFPDPLTLGLDVQEFPTLAAAQASLTSQGYLLVPNMPETTAAQKAMGTWVRDLAFRISTAPEYKGKVVVARVPAMGLLAWVSDERGVSLYGAPP